MSYENNKARGVYTIMPSGASCSKLTMSIVNDSLKFQMAILQIHCIAKDSHIFSTKNNSVFAFEVGIYITS